MGKIRPKSGEEEEEEERQKHEQHTAARRHSLSSEELRPLMQFSQMRDLMRLPPVYVMMNPSIPAPRRIPSRTQWWMTHHHHMYVDAQLLRCPFCHLWMDICVLHRGGVIRVVLSVCCWYVLIRATHTHTHSIQLHSQWVWVILFKWWFHPKFEFACCAAICFYVAIIFHFRALLSNPTAGSGCDWNPFVLYFILNKQQQQQTPTMGVCHCAAVWSFLFE